jgi:cation-transporting ATPase E
MEGEELMSADIEREVGAPQTSKVPWGLTEAEAVARRARGQGNDVKLKTSRTYGEIIRENVFTFFNIVLFGLALLLLLLGSPKDAFFTGTVALFNVLVATVQEVRAKRKLDQIALLTRPRATVIREGRERGIDPAGVVLGDLLAAEAGDQIVVDGQVLDDGDADVDESLLTGESDPIPKRSGDEVYSGSFVVSGRLVYEAQKVGTESMAHKMTEGARTFTREYTPLQREVDIIVRVLLSVVFMFGVMIVLNYLIYRDTPLVESVRAASVVFGLAPSSLFLMIVSAYALGAVRIANKGALVQQANSVESLCHVTVLCLDKTGTLTANKICLAGIHTLGELPDPELRRVLGIFAASVSTSNKTTDAIAAVCESKARPFREEVAFSSALKWSALSLDVGDLRGVYVLGAPEMLEPVLASGASPALHERAQEWTDHGLRVLLFAHLPEPVPLRSVEGQPQLPTGLVPLCLLSFRDELRPEAQQTLEAFDLAGIELKIISGDNPHTVAAVARQAGFGRADKLVRLVSGLDLAAMDESQFRQAALDSAIFGRITPDQKQRLVQVLREEGHYVAMIGDGVNDVLALKQAKLGVAMQSGSQATRGVADIVLLQDSFAALPRAFTEGQRIWNGMEDVLRLYMTRIFSLALLIATIAALSVGFPLTPAQSSIISMLTLAIPAFALALWSRPGPVPNMSIARRLIHFVAPGMLTLSAAGLAVYLYFVVTTHDEAYAQLALTYAMIGMGLILVIFVEPPTDFWAGGDALAGDWRPTLLALGLFVLFFAGLQIPFLRDFYGLAGLRQPADYLIIIGVAIIWTFLLRFIWRGRLFERYLGIDLDNA